MLCAGDGNFSKEEIIFFQNHGITDRMFQYSVNGTQLSGLYKGALAFVIPLFMKVLVFQYWKPGHVDARLFAVGRVVSLKWGRCCNVFCSKGIKLIQEAVYKALDDDSLRASMRKHGYLQLEKFSWQKCVVETKNVCDKLLV